QCGLRNQQQWSVVHYVLCALGADAKQVLRYDWPQCIAHLLEVLPIGGQVIPSHQTCSSSVVQARVLNEVAQQRTKASQISQCQPSEVRYQSFSVGPMDH